MQYKKNEPVYHVPYVRIREDIKIMHLLDKLKAGQEFPIHDEHSFVSQWTPFNAEEIEIMVHDFMGCNITKVPLARVDMFVNRIIPKFKLGDVVLGKEGKGKKSAWRVFEYTLSQGKVWYRDGWGVATNHESGMTEENLRLATKEEAESWEVKYNDDLVKEKKPSVFKDVICA